MMYDDETTHLVIERWFSLYYPWEYSSQPTNQPTIIVNLPQFIEGFEKTLQDFGT
jgi:hypothetical protein